MSDLKEEMQELVSDFERSLVRGRNQIASGYYEKGIENLGKALQYAEDICLQSVIEYNGIQSFSEETVFSCHLFLAQTLIELGDAYCKQEKTHRGIYCYKQAGKVLKAVESSKYPHTETSQIKFEELCNLLGTRLANSEMKFCVELSQGAANKWKNPQELADFLASVPKDSDRVFDKVKSVKLSFFNYNSNSTSCFIATAAYSTPFHPDLDTFRSFRDRKLLSNFLGRIFVKLYYKFSPAIADHISQNYFIKLVFRRQLERLAHWIRKHEN